MTRTHELGCETVHYAWDNATPPRLEIDSGDTVVFRTRDALDGVFDRASTSANVVKREVKGHPLTGPVAIRGARPGDTLQVDVLDLVPGDVGFTLFVPDRGLLQGEFPRPYLKVWELRGDMAELRPGIRVPLAPFLGIMGVALAEPGEHTTVPPRAQGGNMDIKQLTAGSTLYLPVAVDAALFSAGDGHAAQGDGEVCETPSAGAQPGRHYVTTGIAPDLMEASKQAVRSMIAHPGSTCGLSREEAYVLCSVAADLKISEVVDAPNWVVSAFLPLALFRAG